MNTKQKAVTGSGAAPGEALHVLKQARSNFRQGDTITNYDGRIGHRYAGLIYQFETLDSANEAMLEAGFTKDRDYEYLPCTVWTI